MIKTLLHSTCDLCGEPAEVYNPSYAPYKYRPSASIILRVNDVPGLPEPYEHNDKAIQVCRDCYDKLHDLCKKIGTTTWLDRHAVSLTFMFDEDIYFIPHTDTTSILSILYHLVPNQSADSINGITFVGK